MFAQRGGSGLVNRQQTWSTTGTAEEIADKICLICEKYECRVVCHSVVGTGPRLVAVVTFQQEE